MTNKHNLILVAAFLSSLLTACGSAADVNFERYTLTQDVRAEAFLNEMNVLVSLAPVLEQGGVVLQISDVTLRPAKNHRYSASLDEELRVIFVDELMKASLQKKFEQLDYKLYISKFQGTVDGKSIVSVSMQISDPKTKKVVYTGSRTEESDIKSDGYAALVQALKLNYLKSVDSFIADMRALKI